MLDSLELDYTPWEDGAVVLEKKPLTFLQDLGRVWPWKAKVASVVGVLLLLLMSDYSPVSLHRAERIRKRDPSPPPCGILWFYDVPGSGGPFAEYLQQRKKAGDVADVIELRQPADFDRFAPRLAAVAAQPPPGLLVVHHDRGPGLLAMSRTLDEYASSLSSQGCQLLRVVLLVDPSDLVATQLQAGSLRPQSLHLAARLDNPQLRFLLNNHPDRPEEYPLLDGVNATALHQALSLLKGMDVVGFMDKYDLFTERVASLVGWPPPRPRPASKPRPLPVDVQDTVIAQTLWDAQLITRARSELR